MINDLLNDDADFLPCSFYLTPSRLSAVDFLFPLGHDTMTLFVWTGEGHGDAFVLGTFIDPFRPALWALLVSTSLVITTLAVVQRMYEKWRYLGRSPSLETLKFTGSVLWVTLTVYFGKRLDTFPKEVVWKGTLLGTLFVGNFVFISYRASLTSIFSVPTHSVPFKDLESLLESDFKLVVRGSEVVEERFREAGLDEANVGLDAQVWRRKLEPGDGMFAKGALEALKILKEHNAAAPGNMALYCELLHFQTVLAASPMASEACKVEAVWMSPVRTPMSMAVKKGSPYSKLLASALLKELEVGYYYRELAKEMPLGDLNAACDDDGDIFSDLRLGINRIWLMFAVLAAGAVFAALMLAAEKLVLPVGREDVFSEERRKAFRPVLAHLVALEEWVAASTSGAKSDAYDDERDRELEMVAAALASATDRVSAARIVRKSYALDSQLFSDISPKKKYKLFKRRNGSGGVGVIMSESGTGDAYRCKTAWEDL